MAESAIRLSRNFSINAYFRNRATSHCPRYRFSGSTAVEWQTWQHELLPAVMTTLGTLPPVVPLNPEIEAEWEEDGLIKQRIVFDVEEGLSTAAYVYRPAGNTGRLPAILACHGHGNFGKDSVMGNRSRPEIAAEIDALNYDYGLQMAKAGFVTMAIDWRGFNERDDRRKPHCNDIIYGRDPCNVYYLLATLFNTTLLGLNVHDGRRAIDYLCQQDFVDPERLGVMGLSFGGTMATWLAVTDSRIKAADVICYSERFANFGVRDANFCGSQITPGLYDLCDVPDLQGLIAPRPLLVEIGVHDEGFFVGSAMSCYREVEKIYAAAGASHNLELDLFGGHHRWGGHRSASFFRRHFGLSPETAQGNRP